MSSLTTTEKLKQLLPQLFSSETIEGDSYLKFQLTSELSALIDLSHVQESLVVANREITAIPNLPEYVLGLMTSRSQVFLAIDLAHAMELPPEAINYREYQVIVVKTNIAEAEMNLPTDRLNEPYLLGLVVRRILGVSRIGNRNFDEVEVDFPSAIISLVKGTIQQQETKSLLIDIQKLIDTKIRNN